MKTRITFKLTILLAFIIFSFNAISQNQETESPYFFVKSNDSIIDQMPLKSTVVDVNIIGVIADVTVKQVYSNTGKSPLEAIYVFPGSTNAAVYGMTMTIGDRTIKAKVKSKRQALQMYNTAKSEGKRASLLQQHRPNVFQMNVSNILPGDKITVELKYTELLIPTSGVYQFVFPKVVGPRYVEAPVSNNHTFAATPFLHEKEKSNSTFDINVNLNAGMPIQCIFIPNYSTIIDYPTLNKAIVKLDKTLDSNIQKEYIFNYILTGNKIDSGLLLYEGEKENFFLMTVQPPNRIESDNIPPRDYIFIVDVSGSMSGFPLHTSKTLLRNLLGNLRPIDKFNVMLFASSSQTLNKESIPATTENIEKAINIIDNQRGNSSTNMYRAIKKAMSLPKTVGTSRSFVIITDGYVTVEKEIFQYIREHLDKANFYAFGIGNNVNRYIIEGIAHVGFSEPFISTNPSETNEVAERMRKYISNPVLTNIDFKYKGIDLYDIEPVSIPDILGERPVLIYGKYKGSPKGKLIITGYSGKTKFTKEINISDYKPDPQNSALKYIWARKRIQLLDDYQKFTRQDRIQEITNLGLEYNLLTQYTSFIAIDNEIAVKQNNENKRNKVKTIKQPIPLPQGVSNMAVGFDTPEISKTSINKKTVINTLSVKSVYSDLDNISNREIEQKIISKLNRFKLKGMNSADFTLEIIVDKSGYIVGIKVIEGNIDSKKLLKIKFLLGDIDFSGIDNFKPFSFKLTLGK